MSETTRPVFHCECGDHAWVVLTRGYVTVFNPEYAAVVAMRSWDANGDSEQGIYARRGDVAYVDGVKQRFSIMMHTLMRPTPRGYVTDHKNRNTLDNRLRNLRIASTSGNMTNRDKRKSKSQYRGVSPFHNRWRAAIAFKGVKYWLGTHATEAEAALAYDRKAVVLHGDFAVLNFPRIVARQMEAAE